MDNHKSYDLVNEKEVTPYKMLLGAIFKQLIRDAIGAKHYNELHRKLQDDPDMMTGKQKYLLTRNRHEANKARYFIFGKALVELTNGVGGLVNPEYFKNKYKKLEKQVYEVGYEKFLSGRTKEQMFDLVDIP